MSHRMHLVYLSAYSPELNLIEMLWRQMKYAWLPLRAYLSSDRLCDEVHRLLDDYDTEYAINFEQALNMASEYSIFNEKFIKKYQKYINKYPYAFMIIERELRLLEAGRENFYYQNMKNNAKISIKKIAYRNYIQFFLKNKYFDSGDALVLISRFPRLSRESKEYYHVKDYGSEPKYTLLKDHLLGKKLSPQGLLFSRFKYSFFYKRVMKHGFYSLSDNYLEKLNSIVEGDIETCAFELRKSKIKKIIHSVDGSPAARMLRAAAELARVDYFVIAHGYIQDSCLISVGPIYADRLYVWTEKQKEEIVSVINDETQAKKVTYHGWPYSIQKPFSEKKTGFCIRNFLFALEPLPENLKEKENFINIVTKNVRSAVKKGHNVIIRAHPKDLSKASALEEIKNRLASIGSRVDLSKNTINKDIIKSDVIIYTNTSVSIQAAALGKLSVQMKELKKFDFEFSIEKTVDEFKEFIEEDEFSTQGTGPKKELKPYLFEI